MGRNIGGHAHRDARRAVDQQIGEPGRQHKGLLHFVVVVGDKIHGILFDIAEHIGRQLGHTGFGITVSRRRIAVHAAEVAVAVHQRIAQGEILGQTHQGIVHRSIAMGMVPAQHIAHGGGRFPVGLVRRQVVLVHGVKNAPVHRFQTVPHIGQGPADDDAHGVIDVGLAHFLFQIYIDNRLALKGQIVDFTHVFTYFQIPYVLSRKNITF